MSDRPVKVTDHRMFTPDGELRDAFRHLDRAPEPGARQDDPEPRPSAPEPAAVPHPTVPEIPPERPVPGYPEPSAGGPGVVDLIGLLAEPASIYLREAQGGDLATMAGGAKRDQSLELARLHIDLLATLRELTVANLPAQERAMLDDVLYRLRLGYVQAKG